ncbi:MAG: MBL fold metallo-hydrolase [Ancalomicrobiaceae bacterium]|nr:MBL fold metallo-hydrolase [Ancalomicrobiaceae bacterium]
MAKRLSAEQCPGVYRRNIGDIRVATVNDGKYPTAFDHIIGVDAARCRQAHEAAHAPTPPWLTIDTFLVDTGDRLMLVDSGFAGAGPTTGRLVSNLALLGVKPADIDAILMTHLHADHVGGLTDENGQRAFANAELVVHEDEIAFWEDEGTLSRLVELQKPDFGRAQKALNAYRGRTRAVRTNEEVASGVSATPTPGHTPGHSAWRISSGDETLLIWGDMVHLPSIQFAIPEASVIYDVDPDAAAQSRRHVLDMAAADQILVAGIHLSFPGYGWVRKTPSGGFAYVAETWTPVLE